VVIPICKYLNLRCFLDRSVTLGAAGIRSGRDPFKIRWAGIMAGGADDRPRRVAPAGHEYIRRWASALGQPVGEAVRIVDEMDMARS